MNLVIRADADHKIGTGHVMRCLALAKAWQSQGGRASILSNSEGDTVRRVVETSGFGFISIGHRCPDPADLKETLSVLRRLRADWLVLDGYHFSPFYQQALKSSGRHLLVMDDYNHWPEYHADILLNQNIEATRFNYVSDEDTIRLLGPKYVLLRPEFLSLSPCSREIPKVAGKLLVTLGGGDPDNVTLKVIQALENPALSDLETKIVLGYTNQNAEMLQKMVQCSPGNMQMLTRVSNMSELMAWADLAISAGGSTCWEFSYLGVPSMVIILAENQRGNAEGLDKAGIVINLGWFNYLSAEAIGEKIDYLRHSYEQRYSMHQAGRELIDGRGSLRVVNNMLTQAVNSSPDLLKVRPATLGDVAFLWELANDPEVRKNSLTPDPIPWESHLAWCSHKLSFDGTRIWILEHHGQRVAQVRYDRLDSAIAEIGYSVWYEFRGQGYGTRLLALTRRTACEELGVKSLRGLVFDGNTASIKAFTKAGFKEMAKMGKNEDHPRTIFEWNYQGEVKC